MHTCKTLAYLAALALGAGLAAGCGDDGSSSNTGTLNLAITDAAVDDAAALWLTFTQVSLQGVEGAADRGPFAIPGDRQRINLMDYTGTDHAVLLTGLTLPAGTYRLRLDADLTFTSEQQSSYVSFAAASERCAPLPEGAVQIAGEDTCRYPLGIPSGEQAGFRPKGDVTVTAGGNSNFTVEFDLRKNVVDPSSPGDIALKLKPTGLRLVNDIEVGSITGAVTLPQDCAAEDARVYLYDLAGQAEPFHPADIHPGNDTYVTSTAVRTETLEQGVIHSYTIGFVPAGSAYALALTCDPDDDPLLEDALTFAGQVEHVEVIADFEIVQDL